MEAESGHIRGGGNLKPRIVSDVGAPRQVRDDCSAQTRRVAGKIRRVTHAERAPMRSSPNCGTDVEKVSIGLGQEGSI